MSRCSDVRAVSLACCFALAATFVPRGVFAEPTAAELASARDFMKEGKALRAKGDHEGALKKFRAAYAVVPTPITGLAVAEEHVALGQLVEAREVLSEIDRMEVTKNESDIGKKARSDAAALLADLLTRIPAVEVRVTGASDVTVSIDDRPVPIAAAAEGFRVNPGAHTIVARASGKPDQSAKVTVAERDRRKVELAFPTTEPVVAKPPSDPLPPPNSGGTTRAIGLVAAGLGVIAVGVGGALALSAKGKYADARDAHCDGTGCDPEGKRLTDDARSSANTATIVIGVGAALVVGGAIVWLTAPRASESKTGITHVTIGLGTLGLGGAF